MVEMGHLHEQALSVTLYLIEIECLENDVAITRTRCVQTRALDLTGTNAGPLVDEQRFIAVTEPRQIGQPFEVARYRAAIEKISAEQQEWNNQWRTYR